MACLLHLICSNQKTTNMKNLVLLLFILFVVGNVHAQLREDGNYGGTDPAPTRTWSEEEGFMKSAIKVIGSPYEKEDFQSGVFSFKNGKTYGLQARLNLHTNSFQILFDGEVFTLPNTALKEVAYYGCAYKVKEYKGEPVLLKEVIDDKQSALYVLKLSKIEEGKSSNGYTDSKASYYREIEPVYFIELDDQLISLSRFKNLYTAFPERTREMKRFIRSNKIEKDMLEDVTQLMAFLSN